MQTAYQSSVCKTVRRVPGIVAGFPWKIPAERLGEVEDDPGHDNIVVDAEHTRYQKHGPSKT